MFDYSRIPPVRMTKHLKMSIDFRSLKIFSSILLSRIDDFCVDVRAGDATFVCNNDLSSGLFVVPENELWTWANEPNVFVTCCCNEFDGFRCIPNIVKAKFVPIGGVQAGVRGLGDAWGCLFFCKSRWDATIDLTKRVDAFPFNSIGLSLNRMIVCVDMIKSAVEGFPLLNNLLWLMTKA